MPKRQNAPKVQACAKLSPATEETEVARLTRELSQPHKLGLFHRLTKTNNEQHIELKCNEEKAILPCL
jgi:hypothetical protein